MALHSSILAWKIPWAKEPGRLQFMGWQRVGHDRSTEYIHRDKHKVKAGNNPHTNMISIWKIVRRESKCRILEMHLKLKDQQLKTISLKVKEWKEVFHANWNQKKADVVILYQTKQTLQAIIRDKERHYIMIKGSIQEENNCKYICVYNIGAPQYIRQMITAIRFSFIILLNILFS